MYISSYMYVYIYIYICVCVCVCVYTYISFFLFLKICTFQHIECLNYSIFRLGNIHKQFCEEVFKRYQTLKLVFLILNTIVTGGEMH